MKATLLRKQHRPPRNERAFTLIELLVVIAVIAVLAAVLFPMFARAREQARLSTCTSNLKQYGSAFLMYLQDYDETFPAWVVASPYRSGEMDYTSWDLLLQAYVKNFGVSRCPSDPQPAFFEFKDGSTIWRSYSAARNLLWDPRLPWSLQPATNPRGSLYPMKLASVPQPAGTVMLSEVNQGREVNGLPYPKTRKPSNSWLFALAMENYQQWAWERHGERVNALFADGHVKILHGKRQGKFREPPDPSDASYHWPHLDGYVFRPGAGEYGTPASTQVNGDQFWEFCPLPGEPANARCQS